MTNSTKSILENSLKELNKKKSEAESEIRHYENAIIKLEGMILDLGEDKPISKPSARIPAENKTKSQFSKHSKITEKSVRDAIIYLSNNPITKEIHGLRDNYFAVRHVIEVIGINERYRTAA